MTEARRPDPDQLLRRVQDAAAKEGRARLKIWFGMAPGVGKTYAMLEAAKREPDAVIGWVETHGREDTAALAQGLTRIAPRVVEHRGTTLEDFDLDAALALKPKLLLLDELAHSNAPGGRHQKRWQDVLDLLDAGIDVHTTLNVQHVDSLNDVVREVTGVVVRETVPDHILDRADEIELIDLPPDALLARLHEGKVYLGEAASRAADNFFRRGNLLALRELALRRTADRVDVDVRAWREEHAIDEAWGANEKLLVCVGGGSAEVVRAARRLADRLRAPWIAVHVEAADRAPPSDERRAKVAANMRLAESLGAETQWLSGQATADVLIAHARREHVTRVLVGHHRRPHWARVLRPSFVDAVIDRAGDIEVHVVPFEARTEAPPAVVRERSTPLAYLSSALVVGVATAIAQLAHNALALPDIVMIYLVAIMLVALRSGRGPSSLAAGLSVLAYNFFFVAPVLTFAVSDWRHFLTFGTMFGVGLLISMLTLRLRRQEGAARAREARTSALFSLARDLGVATDVRGVAATAVHHAARTFEAQASLYIDSDLVALARSGDTPLEASDEAVVRWTMEHGRPAGLGADALPGARIGCLPLSNDAPAPVLALLPTGAASLRDTEVRHFAELFTRQVGLALGRARMSEAARHAAVRAETEEMRSALLSSVSHDLRTPLASITGAATTLRDAPALEVTVRDELVQSICDEAMRLEHVVANLLDMTRLDSGAVTVNRAWVPTDELIGAVLVRYERELGTRPVSVEVKPQVAALHVDPVLFGQLLGNLVENAIKYTPPDSAIEIAVESSLRGVELAVRDHGPGFSPGTEAHVFERFFRGESDTRGSGLGLAIARAIAHVHGGEMEALSRASGGAIVTCTLPAQYGAASAEVA